VLTLQLKIDPARVSLAASHYALLSTLGYDNLNVESQKAFLVIG
jgi:hypothetical protein